MVNNQSIAFHALPMYMLTSLLVGEIWRQHPTKQQQYGHLPPITKTIKIRRTRHAGQRWRSKDELMCDVLLWTPSHGQAKAGHPVQIYIQQVCANTGCNPEDVPKAMDDWEVWWERVRNIRADSATCWWWHSNAWNHLTLCKQMINSS